jgi:formylglycine-generating enzyme required for sulfatase activity
MSGNVWEWEDSCDAASGDSDTCRVRGGSFSSSPELLKCSADSTKIQVSAANAQDSGAQDDGGQDGATQDGGLRAITRKTTATDIGFRCCL